MRYAESVTGRYVSRARKMAGGPNFDSSLCGHEARPNSISVALGCLYGPKWRRIFVGSSRARWPSVWSPVKAKRCPTVRVCAGVAPDECCRSWCCHVRRRVWRRWWSKQPIPRSKQCLLPQRRNVQENTAGMSRPAGMWRKVTNIGTAAVFRPVIWPSHGGNLSTGAGKIRLQGEKVWENARVQAGRLCVCVCFVRGWEIFCGGNAEIDTKPKNG